MTQRVEGRPTRANRVLGRRRWWGVLLAWSLVAPCVAASSVAAVDTTVRIEAAGFRPPSTTIVAGDTVTWQNTTAGQHTVTADDGSFDSGALSRNDQFANQFQTPGTFAYHCSIVPTMHGTVVVKAAPPTEPPVGTPAPTPPGGTLPPDFNTPVPVPTSSPPQSTAASATPHESPGATAAPVLVDTGGGGEPVGALVVVGIATVLLVGLAIRRRSRGG